MKSIIASIHPDWLQEIKNGQKKIEVRKSAPREPVKYIFWHITGQKGIAGYSILGKCGKVLYSDLINHTNGFLVRENEKICRDSCVELSYLIAYAKEKPIYLWHLGYKDGKLYFPIPTEIYHPAQGIVYKRPPQSWQYCDTPEGM